MPSARPREPSRSLVVALRPIAAISTPRLWLSRDQSRINVTDQVAFRGYRFDCFLHDF